MNTNTDTPQQAAVQREGERAAPRVEYLLRRMLAVRLFGPTLYTDDGELQDNSIYPFIDFLRDHPKDIDLKLAERPCGWQPAAPAVQPTFQARVQPWLLECFGEMIAGDREERNHRFLEESLELVQSTGCTASEAHQLVEYVFNRPVGEPRQEVGGVMVTLAALCLANRLDMHDAGNDELARICDPAMVLKIRAKQQAKPKHSPLPAAFTGCSRCGSTTGSACNGMGCFALEGQAEPPQAHGKSESVACKRCGGIGVVDDGEIDCYPNGEPYLNGSVKCVKDCPACATLAADSSKPSDPYLQTR